MEIARDHVAPVAGNACDELRLLELGRSEIAPMLNHPLDDRPQLGEGLVGLFQREDAGHSSV